MDDGDLVRGLTAVLYCATVRVGGGVGCVVPTPTGPRCAVPGTRSSALGGEATPSTRPADQAIGCLDAAASRVTLGRVVVIVASDLAETGGLGRPAFLVVCSIAEHITILGACSESEHRGRLMGAESRNVAARLRRLRQQRGWTAADLAEECHRIGAPSLTRSTIAKIESGVPKSVTAEEVAALARA